MAGRITSCLRVGDLRAGDSHVSLEQVLSAKGRAARSDLGPTPALGPAVHLASSPASGTPGSSVTVSGTLGAPEAHLPGHAYFCWDGCRDGLTYAGVALHWTSPRRFQARIVVPAAPWIEAGPDRVVVPRPGTYPVGVACLAGGRGCALGPAQGTAAFQLTSAPAASPAGYLPWCANSAGCAELSVSPRLATPGQIVRVRGFAPLVGVIGSDEPFAFQLRLLPGRGAGAQLRLATGGSAGVVIAWFGHASLHVAAPPRFAHLRLSTPVAVTTDAFPSVLANPADPDVVAWCAGTGVLLAGPQRQRRVPIAAAAAALARLGFNSPSQPVCQSAAALGAPGGAAPHGVPGWPPVVVAAFAVAPADQDPLVADVALSTTDSGASWQAVPVPAGSRPENFGGFRDVGGSLEALFAPATSTAGGAFRAPLVEVAGATGRSWRLGAFACPAAGPCVTFGTFQPGNCAMNGVAQMVLTSVDAGASWSTPANPAVVPACPPATLVGFGGGRELLVAAGSRYPVRESTDGGRSWRVLGLPAIPGAPTWGAFAPGGAVLTLLPDGSLLAGFAGGDPTTTSWDLLRPRAARWCSVSADLPASAGALFAGSAPVVLGVTLFVQTTGPAGSALQRVPLASIRC